MLIILFSIDKNRHRQKINAKLLRLLRGNSAVCVSHDCYTVTHIYNFSFTSFEDLLSSAGAKDFLPTTVYYTVGAR